MSRGRDKGRPGGGQKAPKPEVAEPAGAEPAGAEPPAIKDMVFRLVLASIALALPIASLMALGRIFPFRAESHSQPPSGAAAVDDASDVADTSYRVAFVRELPAPWERFSQADLDAAGASMGRKIDGGFYYSDPTAATTGFLILHTPVSPGLVDMLFPAEHTGSEDEFLAYCEANRGIINAALNQTEQAGPKTDGSSSTFTPSWAGAAGQPMYIVESRQGSGQGTSGSTTVLLEKEGNLFFLLFSRLTPADLSFLRENLSFNKE